MQAVTAVLAVSAAALAATSTEAAGANDNYWTLAADPDSLQTHRVVTFPKSRIECGALCSADASCKAYAYNEVNDGPCELSSATNLASTSSVGKVKQVSLNKDVIPVDGNWAEWGEWSACSCSTANKTRTRTCGTPSHGGSRICPNIGEAAEVAECGLPPCTFSQHFMAVGGGTGSLDVEIIDISSAETTCVVPQDFPQSLMHTAGVFMDGRVLTCGGYSNSAGGLDECYSYDFGADQWTTEAFTLVTGTGYLGHTVMLPNNTWMLIGGKGGGNSINLVKDGVTSAGPALPETFEYACGATINETHIFLGGGDSGATYRRAKILNIPDWEFTTLEDMGYNRRFPACGLIDNPTNGLEIVVLGGDQSETTSEILNLADLTWRDGPVNPSNERRAAYAQIENTFIVVGGDNFLNNIYRFDEVNYAWITLDRKLSMRRYKFALIPLPDGLGLCS